MSLSLSFSSSLFTVLIMSYPLNNNTNTARQVNQQHTWMKPDLHLSRQTNISREQELQHKLKQTSLNPATSTTATKNVNSDDFPKLPSGEIGARRKKFATYKFYLDNLEPLVSKRIERGIKIMGAVSLLYMDNTWCLISNPFSLFLYLWPIDTRTLFLKEMYSSHHCKDYSHS